MNESRDTIINMALGFIGNYNSELLNLIRDPGVVANIAETYWNNSRRNCLRTTMPWFARDFSICAKDNSFVGNARFGYRYRLPADCLRYVPAPNTDYILAKNGILTRIESEGGLLIEYIADVENISLWTADFCRYVALDLAYMMTMNLAKYPELQQTLARQAQEAAKQVVAIESQESTMQAYSKNPYIEARRTGYQQFDPIRR